MTAFTTIVASGSFAAAARRLDMSPAMVTNHIRALEDRLGAHLLHRTTRKLALTEAGHAYFDKVARILAEIEAADTSIGDLQAKPSGTLRVTASCTVSKALVPLFAAFVAAFPEITLDLVTGDRMPDLIDEGIDVAIGFDPEPRSRLIMRQLTSYRLICCATPAYLAKHGTPRGLDDLMRHNCLCFMHPGGGAPTDEWHLTGPRGPVAVPVSGNLNTNSAELLQAAVLDGQGIALVPNYRVADDLRARRLVHLFPEYRSAEISIAALYPNRRHLPVKVRSLIDFAVRHFAGPPVANDREMSSSPRCAEAVGA